MKQLHILGIFALVAVWTLSGCMSEGNHPGREYMPDMAHSVAYESNHYLYYDLNTFDSEHSEASAKEEYYKLVQPRNPVKGTVPRDKEFYQPYHLADTAVEAAEAMFTSNPVVFESEEHAKRGLAKGKELYDIYCGVCHGEKGDGNGIIYKDGEGPYIAAPANYLDEEKFGGSTDGRYYHAIVYGKGVMMPHADKLDWRERWLVVHYIRKLQADAKKETYLPVDGKNLADAGSVTDAASVDMDKTPDSPVQGEGTEVNGVEAEGAELNEVDTK